MFLLNKVSFELDTYMKDPCHLDVFQYERINTVKQKDGLTFFLMLNVIEAKIFQYDILEGHNV